MISTEPISRLHHGASQFDARPHLRLRRASAFAQKLWRDASARQACPMGSLPKRHENVAPITDSRYRELWSQARHQLVAPYYETASRYVVPRGEGETFAAFWRIGGGTDICPLVFPLHQPIERFRKKCSRSVATVFCRRHAALTSELFHPRLTPWATLCRCSAATKVRKATKKIKLL